MITKVLVVGDIHTKTNVLQKVIDNSHLFDKIIFLGDYLDDWGKAPEASYNLLRDLLRFKKGNQDKVILLFGNHDLSEWLGGNFMCSGYNLNTHSLIDYDFCRDQSLFNLAYEYEGWLFTHAGVCSGWLKDNKIELPKKNIAKFLADKFNETFRMRGVDREHYNLFQAFATAGGMRGGWHNPSPLWADERELIKDPVAHLNQVVGHTPVLTIKNHIAKFKGGDSQLYFCDTHSTFNDGEPIGDGTFLIMNFHEDGKVYCLPTILVAKDK